MACSVCFARKPKPNQPTNTTQSTTNMNQPTTNTAQPTNTTQPTTNTNKGTTNTNAEEKRTVIAKWTSLWKWSWINNMRTNGELETLCWNPGVFMWHNFITEEEAQHFLNEGKNRLTRAACALPGGGSFHSQGRTSYAATVDNIGEDVAQRIAKWTMTPVENGEPFALIRYRVGEQHARHRDYFDESYEKHLAYGGNRLATVLIYLNEPEEGGETEFPAAQPTPLVVKPKKLSALLFFNCGFDGTMNTRSEHAGKPVIKGEKWLVLKWIRERTYES